MPTAKDILDLLLKKHEKDFCIPECKTDSTFFSKRLLILDLWVMTKSWKNNHIYGYEIKVSRSDFLRDNKWREYLKFCTDFYFVCPKNVILPEEVPQDVGLLFTSINCKKLFTKKMAVTRDVTIPENLYKYILMWRAKSVSLQESLSSKEYWKEWLKEKKIDHNFGRMISSTIKKEINDNIERVKEENYKLKIENSNLSDIKNLMIQIGINSDKLSYKYNNILYEFKNKLQKIDDESGLGDFKQYLKQSITNLQNVIKLIDNNNIL